MRKSNKDMVCLNVVLNK